MIFLSEVYITVKSKSYLSHQQLIFLPLRYFKQDLSLLHKIQVRQSHPSVMSSRWPHICNELNTLKYFIFSKWQRLTTSQSYFPDGVMNLLTLHFHHVPCLEKSVFNLSNTNRASTLCPLMLDSAVPSQLILHILFRVNKFISSLINHIETFNDTFMFFKILHKYIIYAFYEEMEDKHLSEISSSKSV